MRGATLTLLIGGLCLAALSGEALAQVGPLPHAFAGYAQPAIPPGACKAVNAGEAQCVIPAMTAGRYLIEAAGTSTTQGGDAVQALEIDVGGGKCGVGKNTRPWPSGARTFRLDCEVTVLTDVPLMVRALYADAKAVKDPAGPSITIRPVPWNGVLSSQPFAPQQ